MIVKNKIILDPSLNNFQVMMAWEKPYMEKCLEIGFGMGYSATAINKYPLRSYTVIEKDPTVIKQFQKWRPKQKTKKIKLLKGMWQTVIPFVNKKFDCIFFDDSPTSFFVTKRFELFLILILLKNVKYNTRLVSYSSKKDYYSGYLTKHFKTKYYKYNIKIPYFCKYAKGTNMIIEKITFNKINNIC